MIGAEDLVIDRLNAYVHWKSVSDYEQALSIYLMHYDEIAHEYLAFQAEQNEVSEGLVRLQEDAAAHFSS